MPCILNRLASLSLSSTMLHLGNNQYTSLLPCQNAANSVYQGIQVGMIIDIGIISIMLIIDRLPAWLFGCRVHYLRKALDRVKLLKAR